MRGSNRYLPGSLQDANTQEVAAILENADRDERRGALTELLNSGPLSPEFREAIDGRQITHRKVETGVCSEINS
jgi:hypothetical protein